MMNKDKYNTVTNGFNTYKVIADTISGAAARPVMIAWTDGAGTQLDILFVYGKSCHQAGYLQRGMRASTDLFVAVSGHGFIGFELNGAWKSPGYVGEKLGLGSNSDSTTIALADLINGICDSLKGEK